MAANGNKVGYSTPGLMSSSPFLRGLNTELSGIVDSVEFTKDELNMMIRADGSRSRRPGIDYEEQYKFNTQVIDNTDEDVAFSCIEWYDVNSPDEAETYRQTPYIVVQTGSTLIFYINDGQPYSGNQADFTLDLRQYALDTDPNAENYRDPAKYRCKYAIAYGCLFITSEAIKPIRLRSAQNEVLPDFEETFPYCQVTCTAHQGRRQRMGTRNDRPNDKAYCKIYFDNVLVLNYVVPVDSNVRTNPFPNSYTIAQAFNALSSSTRRGITAIPHAANATELMWSSKDLTWNPTDWIKFQGSTTAVRGLQITIKVYGWDQAHKSKWKQKTNTYTGYMTGGSSDYQQSSGLNLQIRDTSRGANDYLSIEYNPSELSYSHLYNLLNQGWTPTLIADFYRKSNTVQEKRVFPGNNVAQQYLKDKKTDAFKPEDLINMTFGNTPAPRGHTILDYFNQDRNGTAALKNSMEEVASRLKEIQTSSPDWTSKEVSEIIGLIRDDMDYTGTEEDIAEAQVPVVKPTKDYVVDLLAYAGRIFYLSGSTLLYSKIIAEDISKSDQCYTEADPTSEEISDVIDTDGGTISLPDIGEGVKLAQVGSYLLIFGTRSNVAITGTANNIFTATAYSAGALNAVPTQAPDSFVDTEFGLFYWGTTGINFIAPNNGLAVQDLSSPVILTWYGKLTNIQHKYCKGVYSSSKKKIYWFYPSDETKPRRLDCALVYDIQKGAFVPHKIATGTYDEDAGEYIEIDTPEVVSGLVLKVPYKANREYPVVALPDYINYAYGYEDDNDNIYYVIQENLEKNIPVYVKSGDDLVSFSTVGLFSEEHSEYDDSVSSRTMVFPSDTTITYYGYARTKKNVTKIYYTTSTSAAEDDPVYAVDENGVINLTDFKVTTCSATSLTFDDNGTTFTGSRDSVDPQNDVTAPAIITATRTGDDNDFIANSMADEDAQYEILDNSGVKILAAEPIESELFTYESSILLCYDVTNNKVTFGDFRNNLIRDWTAGDFTGEGYVFDSYLVSHPMNAGDYTAFSGNRKSGLANNKTMPYLITYFRRTEVGSTVEGNYIYPSKCQGSILWDWRTSGEEGKWSSPVDLYRPYRRTILDNGFIINKTCMRGLGRSYQIKLESVEDAQFIVEGLLYNLKNDGRI